VSFEVAGHKQATTEVSRVGNDNFVTVAVCMEPQVSNSDILDNKWTTSPL